jgi:hypothetical protein
MGKDQESMMTITTHIETVLETNGLLTLKCSMSTSNTAFTVCGQAPSCQKKKAFLQNLHPIPAETEEIILREHGDNNQRSQHS